VRGGKGEDRHLTAANTVEWRYSPVTFGSQRFQKEVWNFRIVEGLKNKQIWEQNLGWD